MEGKKGNEGINQTVKIVLFLLVLGVVLWGGGSLFAEKINFFKWLPNFKAENKTIEGAGIVSYDIANDKAQYFDGTGWINLEGGESIGFEKEKLKQEDLLQDFTNYFYERGEYEGTREKAPFVPDNQCLDSYIVGFEKNYDISGTVFGSSYSKAPFGHIILKEVESKEDNLLGSQNYLDYFLVMMDGNVMDRNNVAEFSFYEGVGASPESKYPFAYNVGRIVDERVVVIDDWILEGKISNDAKKVRLTPDLVFDLKRINGIYLITEYSLVKKEERISIEADVKARMLDPDNYIHPAFYQNYIQKYELGNGVELRAFFLDIMSEWGRLNCKNYERDPLKKRCDVIYQFYIDGRPVEAWYMVSRNRENGEFSNSIFVSNDIWEKGSRYSALDLNELENCEKKLVELAKKWRDSIYKAPVKLGGENGKYYCPFRVLDGRIVVKLENKVSKGGRCDAGKIS